MWHLLPFLLTILALPNPNLNANTTATAIPDAEEIGRGATITTCTEANYRCDRNAAILSCSILQITYQAIKSYNISHALDPTEHVDFSSEPPNAGPDRRSRIIPYECIQFDVAAPVEQGAVCRALGGMIRVGCCG